jgi:hypothetical protein
LLNEDVKEKSKLFERLFKAENRNWAWTNC